MADETLTSRIARVLADRIIQGQLSPGEKLRQDHIAAEFGASHVPVREALLRLEAQGLAISEPRRGMRVTTFSIDELREVAEMRSALEALALRHAAPRLTPTLLDRATDAAVRVDNAASVREWEAANRGFHRMLLAPSEMPRLLSSIDDLHTASARFLFAAWRSDWEAKTDHDHRTILAALRRGNVTQACATLARHVGWIGKRQIPSTNGAMREAYAISG
ncbi:GntR family transcriptional regulator [Paracoccus sp. CPCC 101403]|uniref:GntR family transcriptional regulator n=1 Tax=Paracoccus broussonetiae TaxID=3075834 RepID=A0ABU3EJC3_9RHOB|nr:GntR family transcriptional regulator [Paracoccus sp. CPCC 101403]MDT1064351.1 GntR family transcriptional regulator [Paracoccus sp. CPCC 101403]